MLEHYPELLKNIQHEIVICSIIFQLEHKHTSLTHSIVGKYESKQCFVQSFGDKDLVSMFNRQLKIQQGPADFKIVCTNLTTHTAGTAVGTSINETEMPDIVLVSNQGCNICFLDDRHNLEGLENQKMLINTSIFRFGDEFGSIEHGLLSRFLEIEDFQINHAQINRTNLYFFNR